MIIQQIYVLFLRRQMRDSLFARSEEYVVELDSKGEALTVTSNLGSLNQHPSVGQALERCENNHDYCEQDSPRRQDQQKRLLLGPSERQRYHDR